MDSMTINLTITPDDVTLHVGGKPKFRAYRHEPSGGRWLLSAFVPSDETHGPSVYQTRYLPNTYADRRKAISALLDMAEVID